MSIIDTSVLEENSKLEACVCVFGSGPAGLTLAMSLADQGLTVLLVEAGGLSPSVESQTYYAGSVDGDPYYDLATARLRMFGGTSYHWGGYCIPLEHHDYQINPSFPDTGWPITHRDLDPYLAEACQILEIENDFSEEFVTSSLRKTTFQFSPPVRFNDKFYDTCLTHTKISLCLNTSLINMRVSHGHISEAEVRTSSGKTLRVSADYFALCMGGIENSRYLLWMSRSWRQGLISDRTLGRYWMEHPHASVADIILEKGSSFFRHGKASFAISASRQFAEGILNADLLVEEQAYQSTQGMVADLLCVAPDLGRRLMELLDRNLVCGARVRSHWEQEPLYSNRVALDDNKSDPFGIPQPRLFWKKSESDRQTIIQSVRIFAEEIARSGLGRVRLINWIAENQAIAEEPIMAGWHHMGGTRMSLSPKEGVVDQNLKVHELNNLYIGGSSVFPSGGYANPTLTIVQLSLRLAKHIGKKTCR